MSDVGKVYVEEPISPAPPAESAGLPQEYRRMRSLIHSRSYFTSSDPWVFYEQGMYMKDFSDNCEYSGNFQCYYPTYDKMTTEQLRGYFTWRTRLRAGDMQPAALPFAFVYIYELLNLIGVKSPEEGFAGLVAFRDGYGKTDRTVVRYINMWLRDFAAWYNLDPSVLSETDECRRDNAIYRLTEPDKYTDNELFESLCLLSSYRMEASRSYRSFPERTVDITARVYRSLYVFCAENRVESIYARFFGHICKAPYLMFSSAVFYAKNRPQQRDYRINPVHRLICSSGKWTEERFFGNGPRNREVGLLLRQTDAVLRERYGIKPYLTSVPESKLRRKIINECIDAYEADEKRKRLADVKIDLSALGDIRRSADITRDMLLIGDEAEEEPPKQETPTKNHPAGAVGLTPDETAFLRSLIEGTPYSGAELPSVAADSINEKLMDIIGDSAVEPDGKDYAVVDDYREILKGMI